MPKTHAPMTIGARNIVSALSSKPAGLRREERAQHVASPNSSAAQVAADIAALLEGGAVEPQDADGRYRLTAAGQHAALFGVFGQ